MFNAVESLIFKSNTSSKANPQEFLFFFFFLLGTVLTLFLRQLELDFVALKEIQMTPLEVWAQTKASHEDNLNIHKNINYIDNCSSSER